MYIIYSGIGKQYASAAVTKRHGKNTSVDAFYLGKVIDREKGIYKNAERGIFTFDVKTGEYGTVPEDYILPKEEDGRKIKQYSLDFGDVFFINEFIHSSQFSKVIDSIGYGNPDTLYAMVLFYILSQLANCNAQYWYDGNIVKFLYPNANMQSQQLSYFLESIGRSDREMKFKTSYISYVLENYSNDCNILIDSTGLPNNIHIPLTSTNVHNGKISTEIRLIFVVQKSTGLPLFYFAVPGNIVDVSTLKRVLLHLDSLGLKIDECIMDAGYNSNDNLDLFYDENQSCIISYITRVKSSDTELKKMMLEELPSIKQKENLVQYCDRFLFIKKKKIMVGSKKNNPAWLYLGLDCNRENAEFNKLMKKVKKENISLDEIYEAMKNEGGFCILSGNDMDCEEILPAYYQRQSVEQIFDVAKNYTKLLPLRTNNMETFYGHLLLAYIASCIVRMIQLKLKETNLFYSSKIACLRNQKCTVYHNRIITDVPQKEANDCYKIFGITCPESIGIVDGCLDYKPQKQQNKNQRKNTNEPVRKRGRPKGSKNKKKNE